MGIVDRAREFFSRAKPIESNATIGSVLPDQAIWEQFQRIGGGVTPEQVSRIIRAADTGDMSRLVDLANEARQKDGHLHSVLQTREMAVAGLEWELVYPGETKRKRRSNRMRGARERKFVEGCLRNHPEFDMLRAHLAGATYIGYAVAEIVWTYDGTSLLPKHFVAHNSRRFGFRDTDGAFVYRDRNRAKEIELQAAWPDKFIVSQPRVNGDVPCREGLVRNLMWLALFRNWTLGDLLKLAEMSWKPWRRGVFQKSASNLDIEKLKQILRGMVSSGVAVHSDQVQVHTEWAGGTKGGGGAGSSSHISLFDLCGREMSKATLGQTLTTDQGAVGSQALGKVHNEIRGNIKVADAKHLAGVLNRFLIEPMVRLNFGPQAPVPYIRFITDDIADMVAVANALEKLTGPSVRMRVPANWARDELGIPDPEDGDELLGVYVDTSDFEKGDEPGSANDDETKEDEAA